ncbi:MAG: hypothetical protein NXI27_07675 [Alphaproteobacteria bacterium]|nr:hypothetical protein [Alphaproteobacteria bacterium]
MIIRITAVLFAALSGSAFAQDAPDLVGTWVKTAGHIIYWNGEINRFPDQYKRALIVIHEQTGPVFKATQMSVAADDGQTGRHGKEPLSGEGHPLLGSIGWDGRRILIVDIGDTTVQECTLTDPERMECSVSEAGEHALVGRYSLERQK